MASSPGNSSILWHTAGGDNSRSGLAKSEVRLGARPTRTMRADSGIQAAVVFTEGERAVVADLGGTVHCFSNDSRLVWKTRLAGGISATPAVNLAGERIYVGTHTGQAYALDAQTGKTVWRRGLPTASDPRILSDLLYLPGSHTLVFSSWSGRYFALDADSGEERTSWAAGVSPSVAAAADKPENIYFLRAVSSKGLELVRVKPGTDETVLTVEAEPARGAQRTVLGAPPVLDETRGLVFVILNKDRESVLRAVSLGQRETLWSIGLPRVVQAPITLRSDGFLLLADLGGAVLGIDGAGVVRFSYQTSCEYLLAGGVADATGHFFIGDPLGTIHHLNPQGQGRPLYEAPRAIQARPSLDPSGRLYVPAMDRVIYVFG